MKRLLFTNRMDACKRAGEFSFFRRWSHDRRGFTLVELVIVIAIVVVLMTLILPGSRALWAERKFSDARATLRGMLMSARARATQGSQLETGLFFFVNQRGLQQIVTIEQVPDRSGDVAWDNVFRVTSERTYTLPAPIRVVPRYVVLDAKPDSPDAIYRFSPFELANDNFEDPPMGVDQGQLHRNVFTMVYGTDGQLLVRRDVLILDRDGGGGGGDKKKDPGFGKGDITGLTIGYDTAANQATVLKYMRQDNTAAPIDPRTTSFPEKIPYLIVNRNRQTVALNFPSVDGLLVYDNDAFSSLGSQADPAIEQAKRDFLLRTGQPLYVNRLTGAVIEGPTGENIVKAPTT